MAEPTSRDSSRGMETIWSDTFEGGTFLKWDAIPPSNEISILQSGSTNFGGQSTQSAHTGSQKFVEGWDTNDQLNYIEKTFTNLHEYEKIKFKFYWAEQDIELDEVCDIKIYDKVNGYQTLKTIGSNNGNEDGIVLSDWNIEQYDLYDLGVHGLNEITDWSEIKIQFEWVAVLDDSGETAGDQWFLDDVELIGDHNAQLVNGKVTPQEGTILDTYKYSVVYTDTGNDAPFFVKLNLNGDNISMDEFDVDDTDYTDGKLFTYETDLVWGVSYTYQFWTSDGLEITSSDVLNGPTVNKGPPHKIIVSAPKSTITTDDNLQLSADAYDAHNNPVIFAPVWDVSGGGYINDAGRYTATNLGTWKVYANYTEGSYHSSGQFNVTVTPGKLQDLLVQSSITTTPPVVTTDEVVVFDVIGIDADYNVIPIDDYEIELSITGGGILHEDGTFEPRTKGHYSVYANTTVDSLEISDQYDFQIIQGSGIKLEIFPPPAPIHAGSDALFTVKIFDSKSNSFTPSVIEWSVSGGGTISELGILEARTKGEFTVNAVYINNKNESINGSLKFTVNIGKLQGINIMTQATVLFVNGTVEIYAQGYDGFGNKEIIEPEWNIVGGDYDNYSNTYHAQSAGTWTIYANSSGVSGKVTLYINDKPLSSIVIESDNPIMMIDDEIQLTARGYDADGNELFIDPQWVPTGGGYIDSSGKFKAQEQGIWLLYANFSGISASIEIIINLYDLSRIEVYPAVITLKINEVKKFNATGFASNGVDISIKPIWSITGTRTFGASIDEEGYFVANETGTWRIYASQGGYVGNAEAIVVVDDDKTTPEEDDKEKAFIDEAYLIPLTIIIAAVVVVIILFLIIIRTKNKLEQDKEYVEAEQVAIEEEYSRIYGDSPSGAGGAPVGDSWGERMYPEESGLKTPPPPPPPPGRKPGHRVKEVRVTRRKMRRKSDAVTQPPPGETPSVPAGPMRYGYKAKKVDSGVPVKAPPNVKGSRKLRDKDKKKDQKDDQQIEWD